MIYDIEKTYAENAAEGPFFTGEIPKRPPSKKIFNFLGNHVNSPIGVPAGPLLNAKWVALAGKLGFDILTYKTIRSGAHPSHTLPNVVFVDAKGNQIRTPSNLAEPTITNSFGMPSKSPDFLLEDIERANQSLSKGQVMIVSVVGTPHPKISFSEDFVRAALLAVEAGAKIVEANFSCPNVDKEDGILYESPEIVHEYAKYIAQAIQPVPLLIKVGVFQDIHQMKNVFLAAARGGCAGICGVNSVSMQIDPPLAEDRKVSGVCGTSIRNAALAFVRDGTKIIRDHKLDLVLLGCGGIILPEHFDAFFTAGAQVAMSATGMMWDPYLAMRYHEHSLPHS